MARNEFHYHSNFSDQRVYLNEFGKFLRDQADRDYMASRSLFRRGYYLHSAYMAHQCVEKYFKSILLFVQKSTRRYGHDIKKLMEVNLKNGLMLKEESIGLVRMLDGLHNVSRYRSGNYCLDLRFLHRLDFFVLDIRPYVQNRCVQNEILKKTSNPKRIGSGHERTTNLIHMDGILEKVLQLKSKRDRAFHEDLTWVNKHFGDGKNNTAEVYYGSHSANLPFDLGTEKGRKRARFVKGYFRFEAEIEKLLEDHSKATSLWKKLTRQVNWVFRVSDSTY